MGVIAKVSKWTYTTIKNQDLFPQSVQMTFNGDSEYKTFHSGLISTFVKLFMTFYAVILILKLVRNQDSAKSVNTIVNDISNDQTKHYIGKSTFGIAIHLRGEQPHLLNDPTYFSIFAGQESKIQNGSYYSDKSSYSDIGLKNCTNIFPMSDQEFLLLGLNDALCLENDDFYIQGNSRSLHWNEIGIYILP